MERELAMKSLLTTIDSGYVTLIVVLLFEGCAWWRRSKEKKIKAAQTCIKQIRNFGPLIKAVHFEKKQDVNVINNFNDLVQSSIELSDIFTNYFKTDCFHETLLSFDNFLTSNDFNLPSSKNNYRYVIIDFCNFFYINREDYDQIKNYLTKIDNSYSEIKRISPGLLDAYVPPIKNIIDNHHHIISTNFMEISNILNKYSNMFLENMIKYLEAVKNNRLIGKIEQEERSRILKNKILGFDMSKDVSENKVNRGMQTA